jgi:hypothetical protein
LYKDETTNVLGGDAQGVATTGRSTLLSNFVKGSQKVGITPLPSLFHVVKGPPRTLEEQVLLRRFLTLSPGALWLFRDILARVALDAFDSHGILLDECLMVMELEIFFLL